MNGDSSGLWTGKVWGRTKRLFATSHVECHIIQVEAGGYSSHHVHRSKWNRFCCISGKIAVQIRRGGDLVDTTMLEADQATDVPPGVEHWFLGMTNCVVLEFYWVNVDPDDIDRLGTTGGWHPPKG